MEGGFETLSEYDVLALPVCTGCGVDIIFKFDGEGGLVEWACKCRSRVIRWKQYLFLESLSDELDRSIFLDLVGFSGEGVDKYLQQVSGIREMYFGKDAMHVDKGELLRILRGIPKPF
jgi:hypothetical protein